MKYIQTSSIYLSEISCHHMQCFLFKFPVITCNGIVVQNNNNAHIDLNTMIKWVCLIHLHLPKMTISQINYILGHGINQESHSYSGDLGKFPSFFTKSNFPRCAREIFDFVKNTGNLSQISLIAMGLLVLMVSNFMQNIKKI